MSTHERPAPTRRRRRHWGRRLLVLALVLAGLLVAADRVSLAVADTAAGVTLQRSQGLAARPDVSIDGFPFLTQLVAGSFDTIHVTAKNLTVGRAGVALRIASLEVTLHHVHVARDFRSARSEFSTATALVTYADLSRTLGVALGYAGAGRVQATTTVSVAGLPVTGTATSGVQLAAGSLAFTDPTVTVDGIAVPPQVTSYFTTVFRTSIPLGGLPFGVHVDSVQASAAGITVTLSAAGLTFRR